MKSHIAKKQRKGLFFLSLSAMILCSLYSICGAQITIHCPSPTTLMYGDQLSYVKPNCHTSGTFFSSSTCTPESGTIPQTTTVANCTCDRASQVFCTFQVTVARLQCPVTMFVNEGALLSFENPSCEDRFSSVPTSCTHSSGSTVNTNTVVTCACNDDPSTNCTFFIVVVRIECPQPVTLQYGDQLSYVTPICRYSSGDFLSQSTCTQASRTIPQMTSLVQCTCNTAPQVLCTFQLTVTAKLQCPSVAVGAGTVISFENPSCENHFSSMLPTSCTPMSGSSVITTDTIVTCTCNHEPRTKCDFTVFIAPVAPSRVTVSDTPTTCEVTWEESVAANGPTLIYQWMWHALTSSALR